MTEYTVKYEIELEADSPEEAAKTVFKWLRDEDLKDVCLEVYEEVHCWDCNTGHRDHTVVELVRDLPEDYEEAPEHLKDGEEHWIVND